MLFGRGKVTGGSGPIAAYVTSLANAGSATSYTFTAAPIGAASADRLVVVVVHTNNGNTTSVTIGGASATQNVVENNGDECVGIYSLLVTSGTTADIVVSTSSALCCAIDIYTIKGYGSATPASTNHASNLTAGTTALSTTANMPAHAVAIVGSTCNGASSTTVTYANGETKDVDQNYGSSEYESSAHYTASGAESPHTFQVTPSTSAKRAIAVAVWS